MMKTFLKKILPPNCKDYKFWLLVMVAMIPMLYLIFGQGVNYMQLNTVCLSIILWFMGYKFLTNKLNKKLLKNRIQEETTKKENFWKNNIAFLILSAMFLWMLISCFFSQNIVATLTGRVNNEEIASEASVFNYIFYYCCAVCAIKIDKKNIKHLLYVFLFVINVIIVIQFCRLEFGFGFIHKNHTGYYLIITACLTIGMILSCKNKFELIPLGISLILHFISFVLNHSLGPIIGLIAFLVVAFIYYLIYNRKMLIRLTGIILTCVAVFSFFDFVPKVKDYRTESTPVIIQLRDLGLEVLNMTGVLSEEDVDKITTESGYNNGELAPGSDGYDRLDMWGVCIDNMKEFPLVGVGIGAWAFYNEGMPNRAPHNEFLEYGAVSGIPCLLLYLSLIFYVFIKFRKNHKKQDSLSFIILGAVGAYLVQSFFGNILPFTAPVFYVMFGLAIKLIDRKETEEESVGGEVENNNQNKNDVLEIKEDQDVKSNDNMIVNLGENNG